MDVFDCLPEVGESDVQRAVWSLFDRRNEPVRFVAPQPMASRDTAAAGCQADVVEDAVDRRRTDPEQL